MLRHPRNDIPCGRGALAVLATVCAIAAPSACVVEAEHDGTAAQDDAEDDDATTGPADDADHEDATGEPHGTPTLVGAAPSSAPAPGSVPRDRIHAAACTSYCGGYLGSCERPLGFADESACLATCNGWPLGTPGVLGPTVACHTAMLPGGTAAYASCIAAGPASPICLDLTPSCVHLCTDLIDACGPQTGFADVAQCRDWCGKLEPGTLGDEGDSVGCRQHYAELALTDRRECPAAGPDSHSCTDE